MSNHHKLISYSQIASFLACRKKWHYEYVRELAPRITSAPMQLGTLVHADFEARLREESSEEALTKILNAYFTSREMFDEEIDYARALADKATILGERAYDRFIEKYEPIIHPTLGKLMVEHGFKIPVIDDYYMVGTIDTVVRERATGANWIVDHKVRKQLQPVENEEVNLQMATYQGAMLKEGIETVGSISHQIYHDLPSIPKRNQNGSFSKADIRSDWPTYREAVVAAGLNPEDYMDMAAKLATKEFYRESKAYRNYMELDNTWNEILLPTIREMINTTPYPTRAMSVWNCIGCRFRGLCTDELRGVDVEYTLKHEFVRNTYLDKYREEKHDV